MTTSVSSVSDAPLGFLSDWLKSLSRQELLLQVLANLILVSCKQPTICFLLYTLKSTNSHSHTWFSASFPVQQVEEEECWPDKLGNLSNYGG